MIFEINQVKRWLAKAHSLPVEGEGTRNLRVLGTMPDGDYVIPIGRPAKNHRVNVRDNRIWIGEQT